MKKVILTILAIVLLTLFLLLEGSLKGLVDGMALINALIPLILLTLVSFNVKDLMCLIKDIINREINIEDRNVYKKDLAILDGIGILIKYLVLIFVIVATSIFIYSYPIYFRQELLAEVKDVLTIPFYLILIQLLVVFPCENTIKFKLTECKK